MARRLLDDQEFRVPETDLQMSIPADPEAVYWLRAITSDLAAQMAKEHTKYVPDPMNRSQRPVTNTAALNLALLDYCLVRWEGISGNYPCTLEYKRALPMDVQAAILTRAQMGQVTPEQKAASFRELADVVPVLQG